MPRHSSTELDYRTILGQYPWVTERNHNCILSPDSDGLLCGLLMSHYLEWKIRGFYDGKILAIKEGVNPQDCIFLDMEIFRPNIRSVGQHMVMYDKQNLPTNWSNFNNCIGANNLRNFDFKNDFKLKYPFGTVHMLLSVLGQDRVIPISKRAVCPLLYTDGTFKNQFNYPENCLGWLDFFGANDPGNPLQHIFLDKHYSTYELMVALRDLFEEIHTIGGGKRGGDKIKISDSKGNMVNIDPQTRQLKSAVRGQAERFLGVLANKTGWTFTSSSWSWGPYETTRFKKGSVKPGKARYHALLDQNP